MQTLNGITQYSRSDLDRQAKAVALTHARHHGNGKVSDVSWDLIVSKSANANLAVHYIGTSRPGSGTVYHTSEVL